MGLVMTVTVCELEAMAQSKQWIFPKPIGSMYAIYDIIYGNIYHQHTPNVSIYGPVSRVPTPPPWDGGGV